MPSKRTHDDDTSLDDRSAKKTRTVRNKRKPESNLDKERVLKKAHTNSDSPQNGRSPYVVYESGKSCELNKEKVIKALDFIISPFEERIKAIEKRAGLSHNSSSLTSRLNDSYRYVLGSCQDPDVYCLGPGLAGIEAIKQLEEQLRL